MNQICEKSQCSEDSVRRVLKKHGLSVSRSYKRAVITPEIINRVHELYDSGMHSRDIAVNLNIGSTTARNIINEYKERYKVNVPYNETTCETVSEQQLQLPTVHLPNPLPISHEIKEIPIESLRMIRDAIDMIIEARTS